MKTTSSLRSAKLQGLLDGLIIVFGLLNALATVPQVIEIYSNKSAENVSLFSWGYYLLFALLLLCYGVVHNKLPLILTYTGSAIAYGLVVVGILIY
jgi:uncharacterized protein with PQ loop repeat